MKEKDVSSGKSQLLTSVKHSDKGIFLHRLSYSESSIIATFYTQKNGLTKFLFQGAKKKATNLFPLAICELTSYKRPESDLERLSTVELENPLLTLRNDPIRTVIAFFIVDIIRHSLKAETSDASAYSFLENQVNKLNEAPSVVDFPLHFLCDFTEVLGIQPLISEEKPKYFNLIEGEFTSVINTGELFVDGANVELLHALFKGEKPSLSSQSERREILGHLLHYYKIHVPNFEVERSIKIIQDVLSA